MRRLLFLILAGGLLIAPLGVRAEVCNLKVVTDASPDYTDLRSLIHSVTDKWATPKEKCWAMWYWNHLARRQTQPMVLHGMALTDPIRQFNDYGFTMCSTVSGINCGIWYNMGLPIKYWDISNHTVPEVFYDGRYHMYDNSMSAIYTLCDGVTIAGVEDIGKEGACAASGGKVERGHIAKYHCLTATGPNGFLSGADTQRSLEEESRCFNPNALKYRYYFYDWDFGHRYILNLKPGESYTRYYKSLGDSPEYYVPNGGKDPEAANKRYRIRGNGRWSFQPDLSPAGYARVIHSADNIAAVAPAGLRPAKAGAPASVTFKVQGANVITGQTIRAAFTRKSDAQSASIHDSTNNGLKWTEVWKAEGTGDVPAEVKLVDPVNGAYEVLIQAAMTAKAAPGDVALRSFAVETVTELNSKTQPRLKLGKNTIYVGAGDQTESIVFWPDLEAATYKEHLAAEQNVTAVAKHIGYQGAVHPTTPGQDAFLVYRMDAPSDITRVVFGGRFYNRAPKSHVELLYSLDDGKQWARAWILSSTKPPWDVIHYETVAIPKGHRSVLLKYLMNTSDPSPGGCSIYAARMEANYAPADVTFRPFQVTFDWLERQAEGAPVERSHTQTIASLPFKYTINVGGADHPVMNSLRVSAATGEKEGYSDGKDAGGEKFVDRWVTYGRNLAVGKSYTCSLPSGSNWGAGDPDGKKLTDGVVGPPYSGGSSMGYGAIWQPNTKPTITLDLGAPSPCASFGLDVNGYPWWDALAGEVTDKVEVLTSLDGKEYTSQGFVKANCRWNEVPANHMVPDDEQLSGATYRCIPEKPVTARYVQYKIDSKRFFDVTELEVLDSIKYEPFSLRIALPDEWNPTDPTPPEREIRDPKNEVTASENSNTLSNNVLLDNAPPAGNPSKPAGEPVLDAPTLRSLGVSWIVRGDDNQNARVELEYRKAGAAEWKKGMPLFRVEKNARKKGENSLKVPADCWLFAGSALLLDPDTAYELRLSLADPDGGKAEQVLQARTLAEPTTPAGMAQRHVAPGTGGGSGTAQDPYRGLAAALAAAKPGDLFLLHAGTYEGAFDASKSGAPGKPIIWRAAGDGEVILDAKGGDRAVSAIGVHDVWFEGLTIRGAEWGLCAHESARVVIRRCHFTDVKNGIVATKNRSGKLGGFFIADNVLEGPFPFPSDQKGAPVIEYRGIQVTGTGDEVCYNRISHFKDAIDTFQGPVCVAVDFHNNEISECLDDGIEMDESERNTRCFENRLTNVFQGISSQPVHGGPVYIFRNAIYNIDVETFKLHNSPSGVLFFHNTSVKHGEPLMLLTPQPVRHCVSRNNLYLGIGAANYAYECDPAMVECDYDYDGFGGGPWTQFLKWTKVRYKTLAEAKANAPVFRHAVQVDPAAAFASGVTPPQEWAKAYEIPDLRLKEGTTAIDTGEPIPGINDGFAGKAPDLGAYEFGAPLPHYGPR